MTTTTRRRAKRLLPALALSLLFAAPVAALDLSLPATARLAEERITDPGSYAVPVAPWTEMEGLPTTAVEGRVQRQAWRLDASGLTVLQIIDPLRAQFVDAGWDILLDCEARSCGGFDFRFATEVMRAPAMYVDLTAYRFLSARGPGGEVLTVLASRSPAAGFLQVIRVTPNTPAPVAPAVPGAAEAESGEDANAAPVVASAERDLIDTLQENGHAILRDLAFASGADELGEGPIDSLDRLASFLREDPARRVLFVGHTDATGSAEANVAISRKRANAARSYLRQRHDIPAAQMEADGAGYLAPVASNLVEEGREENRRVEVVLLPAVE
ncbi:OmpA family protein [Alloyangia pacifica]|uniref:OmpA family protein n=1 Tax=Alloyangia pacifica TaxID=311180 RepID=UPI001CD5E030|nr:OmpA family protein [Alloyangia pacifica]MCA0996825.1 OmpA family protein [Alloyangia pacifica]